MSKPPPQVDSSSSSAPSPAYSDAFVSPSRDIEFASYLSSQPQLQTIVPLGNSYTPPLNKPFVPPPSSFLPPSPWTPPRAARAVTSKKRVVASEKPGVRSSKRPRTQVVLSDFAYDEAMSAPSGKGKASRGPSNAGGTKLVSRWTCARG